MKHMTPFLLYLCTNDVFYYIYVLSLDVCGTKTAE